MLKHHSIAHKILLAIIAISLISLFGGCAAKKQDASAASGTHGTHGPHAPHEPQKANAQLTVEAKLLQKAAQSLDTLLHSYDAPPFTGHLARAKGVIIFPALYKGSFIVGIEGGQGVLLKHQPDGTWSAPVFVTLGEASWGFQAGGQISTALLMLMEDTYLDQALKQSLDLGADVGMAAGPAGHSNELGYAEHTGGIIHAAITQGVAFTMALKSGTIAVNHERNANFYQKPLSSMDIVSKSQEAARLSPEAQRLRAQLQTLAAKPVQ